MMSALISQPRHNTVSAGFSASRSAVRDEYRGCLSPQDLETFFREYGERLLGVARRLLRSAEDAEDAVQDAFLSAWASRHTFHGTSTVYTWMYRIVVNTCLMRIRSRPQATTTSLESLTCSGDDVGPGDLPDVSGRDQAANRVDCEELRIAVRAGIDRLPDDFRTILLLRDIEGLNTTETAELLELSYTAAKTRLHRARHALRALLEAELEW